MDFKTCSILALLGLLTLASRSLQAFSIYGTTTFTGAYPVLYMWQQKGTNYMYVIFRGSYPQRVTWGPSPTAVNNNLNYVDSEASKYCMSQVNGSNFALIHYSANLELYNLSTGAKVDLFPVSCTDALQMRSVTGASIVIMLGKQSATFQLYRGDALNSGEVFTVVAPASYQSNYYFELFEGTPFMIISGQWCTLRYSDFTNLGVDLKASGNLCNQIHINIRSYGLSTNSGKTIIGFTDLVRLTNLQDPITQVGADIPLPNSGYIAALLYVSFSKYFVAKGNKVTNFNSLLGTDFSIRLFADDSTTPILTQADPSHARGAGLFVDTISPFNGIQVATLEPGSPHKIHLWRLTGQAFNRNCGTDCLACSGNSDNQCLLCKSGKYVPGAGTIGATGSCNQSCDPACLLCKAGGTFNDCVQRECSPGYTQVGNTGTCRKDCPVNQYTDTSTNTCLACDSACGGTCSSGGWQNCGPAATSCLAGYTLVGTECRKVCQANEYYEHSNNTCPACDSTCGGTCSQGGWQNCGPAATSCIANHTLVGNECRKVCQSGEYYLHASNTCINCDFSCGLTCASSGWQSCGPVATSCISGYSLVGTECRKDCDSSQNKCWKSSDNSCDKCCHDSCQTCTPFETQIDQCLSCPEESYLKIVQGNKGSCEKCFQTCKTCKGPGFDECLSCKKYDFLVGGECGPCQGFLENQQDGTQICINCSLAQYKNHKKCLKVEKMVIFRSLANSKKEVRKQIFAQNDKDKHLIKIKVLLKASNYVLLKKGILNKMESSSSDQSFLDYLDFDLKLFPSTHPSKGIQVFPAQKEVKFEQQDIEITLSVNKKDPFNSPKKSTRQLTNSNTQGQSNNEQSPVSIQNEDVIKLTPQLKKPVLLSDYQNRDTSHRPTLMLEIEEGHKLQPLEFTYVERIDMASIKSMEDAGQGVFSAINGFSATALVGAGILACFGMDLMHPLLAIFQIFKLLNRMRLINVSWGVYLEAFLSQIGNLFKMPDQEVKTTIDESHKHRFKIDEADVGMIAILSIYDKFLIYTVSLILRALTKAIMRYKDRKTELFPRDVMIINATKMSMALVIGLVAYDIALFTSRTLLHTNLRVISSSKLLMINFAISFFFFQVLVRDFIMMIKMNIYFFSQNTTRKIKKEEELDVDQKEEQIQLPKKEQTDQEMIQLTLAVQPVKDNYMTYYNKIFTNQMSLTQGFVTKKACMYQSLFLMRLVVLEPLYVSLQTRPLFQILLITAIQLAFTLYTLYCVFKAKVFKNCFFSFFRLVTESSISIFLFMGLYCQIVYGKVTTEQYYAKNNRNWFIAQFACLAVIGLCCLSMILSLIVTVVISVKEAKKIKAHNKQIADELKKVDDKEIELLQQRLQKHDELQKEGQAMPDEQQEQGLLPNQQELGFTAEPLEKQDELSEIKESSHEAQSQNQTPSAGQKRVDLVQDPNEQNQEPGRRDQDEDQSRRGLKSKKPPINRRSLFSSKPKSKKRVPKASWDSNQTELGLVTSQSPEKLMLKKDIKKESIKLFKNDSKKDYRKEAAKDQQIEELKSLTPKAIEKKDKDGESMSDWVAVKVDFKSKVQGKQSRTGTPKMRESDIDQAINQ